MAHPFPNRHSVRQRCSVPSTRIRSAWRGMGSEILSAIRSSWSTGTAVKALYLGEYVLVSIEATRFFPKAHLFACFSSLLDQVALVQ